MRNKQWAPSKQPIQSSSPWPMVARSNHLWVYLFYEHTGDCVCGTTGFIFFKVHKSKHPTTAQCMPLPERDFSCAPENVSVRSAKSLLKRRMLWMEALPGVGMPMTVKRSCTRYGFEGEGEGFELKDWLKNEGSFEEEWRTSESELQNSEETHDLVPGLNWILGSSKTARLRLIRLRRSDSDGRL